MVVWNMRKMAVKLGLSGSQGVQRKFGFINSKWTLSTPTEVYSNKGCECLELEAAGQMVSCSLSGCACVHISCQWHSPRGK